MQTFERLDHSSGVWFPEEILNALAAVERANADVAAAVNTPEMALYRRGWESAIGAMAAAFGLAYYPPSAYGPRVTVVTADRLRLEGGGYGR